MILLDIGGASVDIGLWAFYILLGLAVATSFLLPLVTFTGRDVKSIGLKLGIGVVVVGVTYAFASDELNDLARSFGITSISSKLVDTGLLIFIGLLALSVVMVIYSEVRNLFNT